MKQPSKLVEEIRSELSNIRSKLDYLIREKNPIGTETLESVSGLMTCGLVTLYQVMTDLIKFEIKNDDILYGPSLTFLPRGIGTDLVPCCFVCKKTELMLSNIAAFVKSREEGEEIVGWFNGNARLDFRQSEPNRVQVKVGACEQHFANLQLLRDLTNEYGVIRKFDILKAIKGS